MKLFSPAAGHGRTRIEVHPNPTRRWQVHNPSSNGFSRNTQHRPQCVSQWARYDTESRSSSSQDPVLGRYTILKSRKPYCQCIQASFINPLQILLANRICSFVYALCTSTCPARAYELLFEQDKSLRGLDHLPRGPTKEEEEKTNHSPIT